MMAVPNKYAVKDVDELPNGLLLSFEKKLKPELLCCTCNAVTPKGLKDGHGHIFCQACVLVPMDITNCIWSFSRGQTYAMDMTANEKEWEILKKMKAACPNDKACPFTGTLEDVLRHYKTCSCQGKVKCPLCDSLLDNKTLADHIRDKCPQRFMNCTFCNADVEACNKQKHEGYCRQRPSTCEHCWSDFRTFAELEEKHIPKCPMVPVHCSFKPFGCTFYQEQRHGGECETKFAPCRTGGIAAEEDYCADHAVTSHKSKGARREVTAHESSGEHTGLLVREVLLVKEENKILQAQEKKYEMRVMKLQEELGHVKQYCRKLDDQLHEQERQFQVEKSKHLHGQFTDQEFLARLKEAMMTLRRALHLEPDQDEDVAAPTQDPELEQRTKNTEEEGAGV